MTQQIDTYFKWIAKLSYLNLLWLGFSVLGLLIGGFFPATAAMFNICRKWVVGQSTERLFNEFAYYFRKEFWKANFIGWIMVVLGVVLYLNYRVLEVSEGGYHLSVVFSFYVLLFLYTVVVVNIFAYLAFYESSLWMVLKNAMIIGLVHFPYTLAIFITLVGLVYVSLSLPAMILFFIGSLGALSTSWLFHTSIKKLEEKRAQSNTLDAQQN